MVVTEAHFQALSSGRLAKFSFTFVECQECNAWAPAKECSEETLGWVRGSPRCGNGDMSNRVRAREVEGTFWRCPEEPACRKHLWFWRLHSAWQNLGKVSAVLDIHSGIGCFCWQGLQQAFPGASQQVLWAWAVCGSGHR